MKKNKKLIETTREEIIKLQLKQDELYQQMVDAISVDEFEEGWLWDYCFNCASEDVYTQRVRDIVYGSYK